MICPPCQAARSSALRNDPSAPPIAAPRAFVTRLAIGRPRGGRRGARLMMTSPPGRPSPDAGFFIRAVGRRACGVAAAVAVSGRQMCSSITMPLPALPLTPGPASPSPSVGSTSPRLFVSPPLPPTPPHSERSFSTSPGPASPGALSPRPPHRLPFSIENILRPDFGRPPCLPRLPALSALQRPRPDPAAAPARPVDLRKERTPQPPPVPSDPQKLANPPLPPEEKMVWPAWVYCTRYSDRPSSGETLSGAGGDLRSSGVCR